MICPNYPDPTFLIIAPKIPPLLYYSHIPAIVISLFLGIFIFSRSPKHRDSRVFLLLSVLFSLWTFINLITWTNNRSDIIFFVWNFFGILYAAISVTSVYFFYAFTDQPISQKVKWMFFVLMAPILILAFTKLNLSEFDLDLCGITTEGAVYTTYYYGLGFLSAAWILLVGIKKYFLLKNVAEKKRLLVITAGIEAFLLSFYTVGSLANYLVDQGMIADFGLEQYGLFGIIFFLAILSYLIVRYKAFNIKIIGTQALVVTLWVLTGSLLLVAKSEVTRIIVALTEIVSIIFGLILIKSVKREVAQREKIEKLASALAETNDELNIANDKLKELDKQKTEFVSVASHQLRAPTTAIKGYSSMLLEGSYGPLEEKAKQAVDVIFQSAQKLNFVIEDFLNITRIELGKMKYEITEIDFKKMIDQVFKELEPVAKRKSLDFSFSAGRGSFKVMADPSKLSQVIMNIVDNSIKYTPSGSIKARLEVKDGKRRFSITDTGVGMSEETKGRLFQKFTRAYNASASNGTGTGLGLFVAKQMIEAQGGRMWVESPGEGKGSTFFVEL